MKPAADASLTELVTVIKSYPDATIDVEGHTDGKGADAYNQSLSERRATAVATWLIAHGNLQPSRVRTKGWGKTKPILEKNEPNSRRELRLFERRDLDRGRKNEPNHAGPSRTDILCLLYLHGLPT